VAASLSERSISGPKLDLEDNKRAVVIRRDGVLLSASFHSDENYTLVLRMIEGLYVALRQHFQQPITGTLVRSCYPVLVMIVDELILAGSPLTTEPNGLDSVLFHSVGSSIPTGGLLSQLSSIVTNSQISGPSTHAISNSLTGVSPEIWWRKSNVFHGTNEFYLDVSERVNCIVSPAGKLVSGSISGVMTANAKLSGVPELVLSFKEGESKNALNRATITFHPCVRIPRWKENMRLSFVPPDGSFILAEYSSKLPRFDQKVLTSILPLTVTVKLLATGSVHVQVSPRLNPTSSASQIERVTLTLSVPGSTGMTVVPTAGTARFDSGSLLWSIGSLTEGVRLEGHVDLDKRVRRRVSGNIPCSVSVGFGIRGWSASGIRVDSVQVNNTNYTAQKGCRYSTSGGDIDLRF
jgi:AP-3 complex subunit mu